MLFVENYSSYRVRTKVLTDRQTDGRTNLIPIGRPPSGGEYVAVKYDIYLLLPGFEGSMLNSVALGSIVTFPKQHYESIVPEKSGINRLSASH